ncbi:hypothetical protein BBJ28_00023877 [Nothophytophthora sp. Chile5]|nr:hypothetical protein BBJ28_00023877 [Nothophytophthora sp. Chile5]
MTAHLLAPLTYRFLQDIQERNRISQGEPEFLQVRTFTVFPTKRWFERSYIKMCNHGLRALLQRAGIRVPSEGPTWNAVEKTYWRRLFNIKKFETSNRKFAGQIVMDSKAVSIVMHKPKREPTPSMREDLFVATNQLGETVSCSTKEFYEEAHYTKAKRKIKGWQDRSPRVLEAIRNMPTKKSASLETLGYNIRLMTNRMDPLLGFAQRKPSRRLCLRGFIFMKRKLRLLCLMLAREGERTVVGFGDWSNQDVAGIIKKSWPGSLSLSMLLRRDLNRRVSDKQGPLRLRMQAQEPELPAAVLGWRNLYPKDVQCISLFKQWLCVITVNRDVNASRNMLRLLQCKLNGTDSPVAYTRQAMA